MCFLIKSIHLSTIYLSIIIIIIIIVIIIVIVIVIYHLEYQFTHVIQKYTNLPTLKGYVFRILQHFATKLCNITNSKTLLLAVVIDFVLLAQIKI